MRFLNGNKDMPIPKITTKWYRQYGRTVFPLQS